MFKHWMTLLRSTHARTFATASQTPSPGLLAALSAAGRHEAIRTDQVSAHAAVGEIEAREIPADLLSPEQLRAQALDILRPLDGLSVTAVCDVLEEARRLACGLTRLDCSATEFVRAAAPPSPAAGE